MPAIMHFYKRSFHSAASCFAFCAVLLFCLSGSTATLMVGPGKTYTMISAAAAAAAAHDTVLIDSGTYSGASATTGWQDSFLTIRCPKGRAHMVAAGAEVMGKGIWVMTTAANRCRVENIEFSGATVPDNNGAGIRMDCPSISLSHCYFHDNQDGILTAAGTGSILVEYCEFADNGAGDGYSHNMYIGAIDTFTIRFSYSHGAKVGHLLKSRARVNFVLYNRLTDESGTTASYECSFPQGGTSYVIGNLIEQSAESQNGAIVDYASEGNLNGGTDLYCINNTIVNDRGAGTFFNVYAGSTATITNNLLVGTATTVLGNLGDTSHCLRTDSPGLVNQSGYDYQLTSTSPAINKGVAPGSAHGFSLAPVFEYVHPCSSRARPTNGALDIGAYEYSGAAAIVPWNANHRAASVATGSVLKESDEYDLRGRMLPSFTRHFDAPKIIMYGDGTWHLLVPNK